jgi:hypothetical protein
VGAHRSPKCSRAAKQVDVFRLTVVQADRFCRSFFFCRYLARRGRPPRSDNHTDGAVWVGGTTAMELHI